MQAHALNILTISLFTELHRGVFLNEHNAEKNINIK
jgi:hypothetical protein